jgi:hypothetical protein
MESLWSADDRLIIPVLSKSDGCYMVNGEIRMKGSGGQETLMESIILRRAEVRDYLGIDQLDASAYLI